MSYLNSYQKGAIFYQKHKLFYTTYCHAWKRDENGKKVFSDWSNAYPFVVSAITPDAPVITNVTVSGSTIKVTYKAATNATGYDVVLGTDSKKENAGTGIGSNERIPKPVWRAPTGRKYLP